METVKRVDPNRRLRQRLRKQIEWGRWGFLAIIAVTLLNQILLLCGAKYHFLFSAAMPYYLNWLAIQLNAGGFQAVATLLTVFLYLAYAACWLLSGQQKQWMLASVGMYALDTVLLIVFALTLVEKPSSCLLEILTHCVGLVLLGISYRAFDRLSKMPRRRRPPVENNPGENQEGE